MLNSKEYLQDNLNKINETLNNSEFYKFLNIVYKIGVLQHKKKRKLDEKNEIETYPASKGFSKISDIGNVICNKRELWPKGVSADVILSQKIPVIKVKNIMLTMKSTKNIDSLWKKPTGYMKQYSKLNKGITPQIDMLSNDLVEDLDELKVNLASKYYGILAYDLGSDNTLKSMKIIFLSDNANSIVHTVNIPIIKLDEKIVPENRSLKDKIQENKGESLKSIIGLK
jgi:hypothetical protein